MSLLPTGFYGGSDLTPQQSDLIKGSKVYYIEALFTQDDTNDFKNTITVDMNSVIRETQRSNPRPKLYSISLSDYSIKRKAGFVEADRELMVLQCPELTDRRYLTSIFSDFGSALSGANAVVVQSITNLTFNLGFIDVYNLSNKTVYNPNSLGGVDFVSPQGYTITFNDQQIEYCLIRLALSVSYL